MVRRGIRHLGVTLAGLLFASAYWAQETPRRETPTRLPSVITGEVTYRERIALAPDAELRVRLLDVLPTAPAVVVSERTIRPSGNVPIRFALPFRGRIDPTHRYAVDARLVSGGREWHTIEQHPVLTEGAPHTVSIVLQ